MHKIYQYFISSTYEDLKTERLEIVQAIMNLGGVPVGMENFPAAGMSQIDLIKKLMCECDYYILILGGRYGSIGPGGISYTEIEYNYALENNIPIISFLHSQPDGLPRNKTEIDNKKHKQFNKFRNKVKTTNYQLWENCNDLKSKATASLAQAIILTPRPGWIRVNERIQSALFPSIETSGSDLIVVHLKNLDVDANVYIQFFEEDEKSRNFDKMKKTKSYKLDKDRNIYTINKKDLAQFIGKVFKLFCKVNNENRYAIYKSLCENGFTVNGPGHEDSKDKGKWLIWFLTPQEPLNLSSTHVGTANQILTSRAYPRVRDKSHTK